MLEDVYEYSNDRFLFDNLIDYSILYFYLFPLFFS